MDTSHTYTHGDRDTHLASLTHPPLQGCGSIRLEHHTEISERTNTNPFTEISSDGNQRPPEKKWEREMPLHPLRSHPSRYQAPASVQHNAEVIFDWVSLWNTPKPSWKVQDLPNASEDKSQGSWDNWQDRISNNLCFFSFSYEFPKNIFRPISQIEMFQRKVCWQAAIKHSILSSGSFPGCREKYEAIS